MILQHLISKLHRPLVQGSLEAPISGLADDSRRVDSGYLFAAIRGAGVDGHAYIPQAIAAGARAILAEIPAPEDLSKDITWIQVPRCRQALSKIAASFYHDPSHEMKVIGITGTNGKTTTSFLIHALVKHEWLRAGLIGTVRFDNGLEQREATHTTPGPIELQELLGEMRDNGCRAAVMEVSSHALDQGRADDVAFDVGVFTNLTQDHLDYHGTMAAYLEAKKKLFLLMETQDAKKKPTAVINVDDPAGAELANEFKDRLNLITFGYSLPAQMRAVRVRTTMRGSEFELAYKGKSYLIRMPLIGRFNVSNTLAAVAAAVAAQVPIRECVRALSTIPQVPGRLELAGSRRGMPVFVDYAHTPDALIKVCSTLKELEPERLITVFGCGGDRDKTKRPLMGEAASSISDFCIVTSDNPRSEDPEAIIADITRGMKGSRFVKITDRAAAIEAALRFAKPGDIILIAGKGHEDYQDIQGIKHPFRDHSQVRSVLQRIEKEFQEEVDQRRQEREKTRPPKMEDRPELPRDPISIRKRHSQIEPAQPEADVEPDAAPEE